MSNFVIESHASAIEAAQQYSDLGLPMPTDLVEYLTSNGIILTDDFMDAEEVEAQLNQDQ